MISKLEIKFFGKILSVISVIAAFIAHGNDYLFASILFSLSFLLFIFESNTIYQANSFKHHLINDTGKEILGFILFSIALTYVLLNKYIYPLFTLPDWIVQQASFY